MSVKLVSPKPNKYFYKIHLRYSIKAFPKNTTYGRYEAKFKRLLTLMKIPCKECYTESWNFRGRRSFVLWVESTDSKMEKVTNKLLSVNDGVLRTVQVEQRYRTSSYK